MEDKKFEFSQNVAVFRTSKLLNVESDELTNSEVSFLMVIYNMPKPVNSVMVSKFFDCTKVYVCKVVGILVDGGYVTKTVSQKDRRAFNLELTEKGLKFVKDYMDKYIEITSYLYDQLGEEKANQLNELLKQANVLIKNKSNGLKNK